MAADLVCVLYAQQELAAGTPGQQIIEQRGADGAQVQIAGGRGRKACASWRIRHFQASGRASIAVARMAAAGTGYTFAAGREGAGGTCGRTRGRRCLLATGQSRLARVAYP